LINEGLKKNSILKIQVNQQLSLESYKNLQIWPSLWNNEYDHPFLIYYDPAIVNKLN